MKPSAAKKKKKKESVYCTPMITPCHATKESPSDFLANEADH